MNDLTTVVQALIEEWKAEIDRFIEQEIEPMSDLGNPEKLIKKKYEEWTEQDKVLLGRIYGSEPNPLSKFIADREIEELLRLQQEDRYAK